MTARLRLAAATAADDDIPGLLRLAAALAMADVEAAVAAAIQAYADALGLEALHPSARQTLCAGTEGTVGGTVLRLRPAEGPPNTAFSRWDLVAVTVPPRTLGTLCFVLDPPLLDVDDRAGELRPAAACLLPQSPSNDTPFQ